MAVVANAQGITNHHNRSGERISAARLERVLGAALIALLPPGSGVDSVYAAVTRICVRDGSAPMVDAG